MSFSVAPAKMMASSNHGCENMSQNSLRRGLGVRMQQSDLKAPISQAVESHSLLKMLHAETKSSQVAQQLPQSSNVALNKRISLASTTRVAKFQASTLPTELREKWITLASRGEVPSLSQHELATLERRANETQTGDLRDLGQPQKHKDHSLVTTDHDSSTDASDSLCLVQEDSFGSTSEDETGPCVEAHLENDKYQNNTKLAISQHGSQEAKGAWLTIGSPVARRKRTDSLQSRPQGAHNTLHGLSARSQSQTRLQQSRLRQQQSGYNTTTRNTKLAGSDSEQASLPHNAVSKPLVREKSDDHLQDAMSQNDVKGRSARSPIPQRPKGRGSPIPQRPKGRVAGSPIPQRPLLENNKCRNGEKMEIPQGGSLVAPVERVDSSQDHQLVDSVQGRRGVGLNTKHAVLPCTQSLSWCELGSNVLDGALQNLGEAITARNSMAPILNRGHFVAQSPSYVPAAHQSTLKLAVFDFDCTLTRSHVFASLAGIVSTRNTLKVPPPHSKTEKGQMSRLCDLDVDPKWGPGRFALEAFGGEKRVSWLRSILQDLCNRGIECVVLSRGLVGPIKMCLEQVRLLSLFAHIVAGTGNPYGFAEHDCSLLHSAFRADTSWLGKPDEDIGGVKKSDFIKKLMREKMLGFDQVVFIDDEMSNDVQTVCQTIASGATGVEERELQHLREMLNGTRSTSRRCTPSSMSPGIAWRQ